MSLGRPLTPATANDTGVWGWMGPSMPRPIRESTTRVGPKGTYAAPEAAAAQCGPGTSVATKLSTNAIDAMTSRRDFLPGCREPMARDVMPPEVEERTAIYAAPQAASHRGRREHDVEVRDTRASINGPPCRGSRTIVPTSRIRNEAAGRAARLSRLSVAGRPTASQASLVLGPRCWDPAQWQMAPVRADRPCRPLHRRTRVGRHRSRAVLPRRSGRPWLRGSHR